MYDVIVIGLGSMGSSTLFHLAKSGAKALGLEKYGIVHENGSHSGISRIIRKSYFEHPNYVPLLEAAYHGWDELEHESGEKLVYKNGLVYYGEPDHEIMRGVKHSSHKFEIELENKSLNFSSTFKVPDTFECLYEPDSGYVLADQAIKSYINLAKSYGAEVQTQEAAISFHQEQDFIQVQTHTSAYRCRKLVITAGPMVGNLVQLSNLNQSLTLQYIFWVKPKNPEDFKSNNFPCWMIIDENYPGLFYGFPIMDTSDPEYAGLYKIAHHVRGEEISEDREQTFDSDPEYDKIKEILTKYIPDFEDKIVGMSFCTYTNSVDDHFIIDFVPDTSKSIILATGFSGHGFKFAPVIGKTLSEMALKGETNFPIDFLSLDRFK